eukprot:2057769-Prymnesium_polylepis.1
MGRSQSILVLCGERRAPVGARRASSSVPEPQPQRRPSPRACPIVRPAAPPREAARSLPSCSPHARAAPPGPTSG